MKDIPRPPELPSGSGMTLEACRPCHMTRAKSCSQIPGSPFLLIPELSQGPQLEPQLLTQVDVSKGPTADLTAQAILIPHTQLHASTLLREKQRQVIDRTSSTRGPGPFLHQSLAVSFLPLSGKQSGFTLLKGSQVSGSPHAHTPGQGRGRFGTSFT